MLSQLSEFIYHILNNTLVITHSNTYSNSCDNSQEKNNNNNNNNKSQDNNNNNNNSATFI